ncbi:MAG TPA: hypothetical protein VK249_13280 [Anaerolineales bacterium]|nr:hypothetical protein [Anaerolineales bacterium]
MKSEITMKHPAEDMQFLFRLAGAAAILMLAIILIQLVVFMSAPPPYEGTAIDWFNLFQENKLIGLIDFEFLMVIYTVISILVTVALYLTLKHASPAFTALYLALSVIGVMAFIAARPAFEMLYLSNGYAAAGTEAQRAMFLAAGEAKLATFDGTAFQMSYVLGSLTGLIISMVMLRTNIFSKRTAYVRIASSLCDFGLYIPTIGIFISILSVLFLFIWNILIARRLFQLANAGARANETNKGLPVEG